MASKAAVAKQRKHDRRKVRLCRDNVLRGERGEKKVKDCHESLLRQKRIFWFIDGVSILDRLSIDFMTGLVIDGVKMVCVMDVYTGFTPIGEVRKLDSKKRAQRRSSSGLPVFKSHVFKPRESWTAEEGAEELFKFLKKHAVSVEGPSNDLDHLFGSKNKRALWSYLGRHISRKQFENEWVRYFRFPPAALERRGGIWNHFCLVAEHADEETRTAVREEVDRLRKEVELANNARIAAKHEEEQKRKLRLIKLREIVCDKLEAAGIQTPGFNQRDGPQHHLPLVVENYFKELGMDWSEIAKIDIDEHWLKLLERVDRELLGWRGQIPELLPLYTAFQEEQEKKMRVAREEEENRGREEAESVVVVENTPPALPPVLLSWRQKLSALVRRLRI